MHTNGRRARIVCLAEDPQQLFLSFQRRKMNHNFHLFQQIILFYQWVISEIMVFTRDA